MVYWLLLIVIIFFNIRFKKNEIFYLKIGFYTFCAAALINIINLVSVAEIFFRISLIFLIFGFILTVKEYKWRGSK